MLLGEKKKSAHFFVYVIWVIKSRLHWNLMSFTNCIVPIEYLQQIYGIPTEQIEMISKQFVGKKNNKQIFNVNI